MRRRSFFIAAAVAVGSVGAGTARAEHRGFPAVLRPAAADLFPEGVAWDHSRRALLVGSFAGPGAPVPTISAVGRDGVATTIVRDPEVRGFFGLEVDERRDRIVAVAGNPAGAETFGLAVYDLHTGEREQLITLSGEPVGARSVNDVAIGPDGTAYVTDPLGGAIHAVDTAGRIATLVRDPRLAGSGFGVNGIVWHPRGYLLTVVYSLGTLYRVSRTGEVSQVRTPEPLVGGDGLALRPDGRLIVVTNTMGGPGTNAVREFRLAADARFAVPVRGFAPWPDPAPTTVAVTPHGAYVLDGHLDIFFTPGGTTTDFVLRRI
ncbi:hypothetical protein LZG04_28670 [Saccharothrix sp. S26]|uniref:hypothetical protein n=1 Tax=Saccharothrix sp. S26 TaxID=2907215 RepID=UPI001F382022|nr:hypothetical protein [Saccharothrix sp. S26]MCE6998740.1 hypothetical protein [Saccharothrix sp. S26]